MLTHCLSHLCGIFVYLFCCHDRLTGAFLFGTLLGSAALRMNQRLSVVMPNYNDSMYLMGALTAICEQSHPPFEVIVVDDGSTDNSVELIESLANRYKSIRLIRNEHNRGIQYSVEKGLAEASGDYLCFASANDFILPGFFEKSLSLLREHPEAGLCCTDVRITDVENNSSSDLSFGWSAEGTYFSPMRFAEATRKASRGLQNPHSTTCINKREFLLGKGPLYDPELGFAGDWFASMVTTFRHGCCYVPEVLATVRFERRGFCYRTENSSDRRPYKAVMLALFRRLLSVEYADICALVLKASSLRAFQPDVQTPELVLKALFQSWPSHKYKWLLVQYVVNNYCQWAVQTQLDKYRGSLASSVRAMHSIGCNTTKTLRNLFIHAKNHAIHRQRRIVSSVGNQLSHTYAVIKRDSNKFYWMMLKPGIERVSGFKNQVRNSALNVFSQAYHRFARYRALLLQSSKK